MGLSLMQEGSEGFGAEELGIVLESSRVSGSSLGTCWTIIPPSRNKNHRRHICLRTKTQSRI